MSILDLPESVRYPDGPDYCIHGCDSSCLDCENTRLKDRAVEDDAEIAELQTWVAMLYGKSAEQEQFPQIQQYLIDRGLFP